MGLKHLKEQNIDLNINLIDILSHFDPTKTKKLTPFLLRVFRKRFEDLVDDFWRVGNEETNFTNQKFKELNGIEKTLTIWFINNYIGAENIDKLPIFADYLDKGLVDNKDISTYKSMNDMISEIAKASTKEMLKKSKKDIMIVYEDNEWLFFKPLTHEAAITYGYGTKWCTSMKSDPEYFYRYSNEGVLIYTINKKTNNKFGIHSNRETKIGIYDEVDNHVDSFETGINHDLLKKLFGWLDVNTNHTNYELFSLDEKMKSQKFYGNKLSYEMPMTEPTEGPILEETQDNFTLPGGINIHRFTPPRLVPRPIVRISDFPTTINTDFDDLP